MASAFNYSRWENRPLTKGEHQAVDMAQWLVQVMLENTHLVVSLPRRTQQTATVLEREFGIVLALSRGAS